MNQRIFAFLKKEFLTDISYTLSFLVRWLGIIISIITFYYISRLMGHRANAQLAYYGGDYFAFVLIGLATMSYLSAAINGFAATVTSEQCAGTLEVLLSTPTKLRTLLFSFSLYNLLMGFLAALLYICIGCILGVDLSAANFWAVLVTILLATFSFLSLGIFAASCAIIFKRGDPVVWVVANLFWLFGGVYFPITAFPMPLQKISLFIPSTYAIRALRLAMLKGYSIFMLKEDLYILLIFACVLWVTSVLMFRQSVQYAKRKGTIAFY